jgi:tyrosine-protein kinase Etk/Wzc
LAELKKKYDYIVLDTAPISPVSDSHHLCTLVDTNVFVVRDKYTHKNILQNSIEELKSNKVENYSIIINDIQLNKKSYGGSYGYNYGYKYGYKYGYGYGNTAEKRKKGKKKA